MAIKHWKLFCCIWQSKLKREQNITLTNLWSILCLGKSSLLVWEKVCSCTKKKFKVYTFTTDAFGSEILITSDAQNSRENGIYCLWWCWNCTTGEKKKKSLSVRWFSWVVTSASSIYRSLRLQNQVLPIRQLGPLRQKHFIRWSGGADTSLTDHLSLLQIKYPDDSKGK